MRSMRTFIRTRGVASSLAVVLLGHTPEEISQAPPLVELHALAPRQVQSQSFALTADRTCKSKRSARKARPQDKRQLAERDIFKRNEVQPWSGNLAVSAVTTADPFPEVAAHLDRHIDAGHVKGMDWFTSERAHVSTDVRNRTYLRNRSSP